jgi:hypothetical protein
VYCYGSGAGYGRFIDRVEQPLFVPGQKTNKSGNRKATSCRHVRCVETGEVFERVSDIGKLCPSYNLDKLVPCILNAMRTGNRSLGHKWVRVTDEQYVEYIEQNQKLLETLRDNPAAKEHGSLAAARLPKEAQCGCAKCAMAREQLKCYAIMATAQGGVRPAMVLTDERDAYDMCAALEAAGAVLTEKVSYEVVETILRH